MKCLEEEDRFGDHLTKEERKEWENEQLTWKMKGKGRRLWPPKMLNRNVQGPFALLCSLQFFDIYSNLIMIFGNM